MGMSPKLLRPRATGFNPKSIAELAVWLDASDSTTVTLSTGVIQWRSKVPGSNIAANMNTANNQPAYQTSQQNGKNALYFDGINDALSLGNISSTFPSGGSVVIAYRVDGDTEYAAITTGNNSQFWAYPPGRTYIGAFKGTRVNNLSSPSMPTNSAAIVGVSSGASAYAVYINNVLAHNLAADFAVGTNHQIGLNDLGTYMKGWVYEIVYYSRAISAAEVSALHKYLSAKWAI